MSISPRALVDLILLGPAGDRRQLQDSPVLGDVWLKFAADPDKRLDLLITPHRDCPAGPVAKMITHALRGSPKNPKEPALVAYLQGLVAARLTFRELLRVIVPRTTWWEDRKMAEKTSDPAVLKNLHKNVLNVLAWIGSAPGEDRQKTEREFSALSALDRYIALAGIILWAGEKPAKTGKTAEKLTGLDALLKLKSPEEIVEKLRGLVTQIAEDKIEDEKNTEEGEETYKIHQISLNRKVLPALEKSVPAVKGDAGTTLFKVKCNEIAWAVIDSGIDQNQVAFEEKPDPKKPDSPTKRRVVKAFDFRNIRQIVSLDNEDIREPHMKKRLAELLKERKELNNAPMSEEAAISALEQLAKDAGNDRPINWALVEKFIEVSPQGRRPTNAHGTHVAGIIGARGDNANQGKMPEADGMCPDIKLYDFRVLGNTLEETEFAIIAALQFIRYLNERNGYIRIHGANLSLSIPHDVRNFACGRTPICNECERLIESGVVVVAAAGNLGYHSFETKDGGFDSYAAFSITDPGNADGVITVGATHRFWPHTYGISFFSSRGPTGDGRMKPDLVAPGERIRSCVLGDEWGELDGTSMAAPHVSGAAAMLLARYSELVGQPRKVKRILCESATDLGRERSFQGHGMLDVLRALQKI